MIAKGKAKAARKGKKCNTEESPPQEIKKGKAKQAERKNGKKLGGEYRFERTEKMKLM